MNINELYSRISHEHPKSETAEIVAADNDRSYFNLCQRFLDVALNAEKVIDESGKLVSVFQYSDIDTAKQTAIEFLSTHHIKDIDSFFTILEQYYPLSVSPDEQRQKAAIYKEKNEKSVGYAGTFYDFTRISDDIYKKIVDKIKASITH